MSFADQGVRFGIHSGPQHAGYEEYRDLWVTAERLGYDWASVFDHFLPIAGDSAGPCLEGLSLLGALAAQTSRIRCGILVVGNTYRHPALLANIAATLDHVSGGRFELGLGAGWYELEHQQYGMPLPPVGRRIRMLGESAAILRSLWREPRTSFEGRYYSLADALCEPKPLQPDGIPLWIGGAGEQLTLREVARHADGWNTFLLPLDEYRRKIEALDRHCADVGRDPTTIRRSLVLTAVVAATESEVEAKLASVANQRRMEPEALRAQAIVGTPQQAVEQFAALVELGVRDFILGARPPADIELLELVANEVAPAVRATGGTVRR
jgi:F420-dependent oxidoreductase-like protein